MPSADNRLQIQRLADEILRSTEPPGGTFLELMASARPKVLVCIGLLQQSRRSFFAIQALTDAGLSDTHSSLLRTILENVVTGLWLMNGPPEYFEEFLGDQKRRLVTLANQEQTFQPLLSQFEQLMDTWVGHHHTKTLRPLEQRVPHNYPPALYMAYRLLSGRTHGSFVASTFQFSLTEDEELVLAAPSNEGTDDFVASASLICILAMAVFGDLGEELVTALLDLELQLLEAWGADMTGIRELADGGV